MQQAVILFIVSIFLYSCSKETTASKMITIKKDWSVLDLEFEKSTIEDFNVFAASKNIKFERDSLFSYSEYDSIEFSKDDDYEQTICFTNEQLGLKFIFSQQNEGDDKQNANHTFEKYEISNFSKVKFANGLLPKFSSKERDRIFVKDSLLNSIDLYEAYSKNNYITAGVQKINDSISELKIIIGSQKIN